MEKSLNYHDTLFLAFAYTQQRIYECWEIDNFFGRNKIVHLSLIAKKLVKPGSLSVLFLLAGFNLPGAVASWALDYLLGYCGRKRFA